MSTAEQDWIAQIAAGDREAFRTVYEKYGKIVYRRALAQAGSKEEAQKVLKNVFRTMLRQLQASDRDPMLFLLQSLTDLETGHTAEEPVAPDADSQQPATQEPEQNSVAAPVVDQPKVQAEPETLQEAPGAESAFEENASLFDRAEAELQGEYEATALNPDELAQLADKASNAAPAEASAQKDSPAEPQEGEPRKSRSGLTAALLVLLVLLVLLTLWFGAGVLMMYSIIPKVDLGYSWFNQNLFNLFRF